jgi:two-component system response regulator DevR
MVLPAGSGFAVLLVDDHDPLREAVAQLLEESNLVVCAQARTRNEALRFASVVRPDVALVDLSLGDDEGLALVVELHDLGVPVVVCSSHEEPEHVRRALASGARAYVAKRDAGSGLVRTLHDVLAGWILISPRAAEDLR